LLLKMTSKQIEARLTSQDMTIVGLSIDFVRDIFDAERTRSENVSSRATNLLALGGVVAGLTGGLIATIASFRQQSFYLVMFLDVGYSVMIISILLSVWWALGGRRKAVTARPSIDDVFDFQVMSEIDAKRRWLSDLISAYNITVDDVNRRVDAVYSSKRYLTIAVFLLGIVSIVMTIANLFK
jgi:hypothetical protein